MLKQRDKQQTLGFVVVNLEERVAQTHPLRAVEAHVDFDFVLDEVRDCYASNGRPSEDPVLLLKLMFLLFWDNVKSERELMRSLPCRLDYLWFLGLDIDDHLPDHSILSKARKRWGEAVFERVFIRSVQQCVKAG